MKVLIVVVCITCISAATCDADADAQFIEISNGCVKETGIEADAWKKAAKGQLDDAKMPDYLFCINKQLNFVNDSGKYQLEELKAGLLKYYSEELSNKYIKECTKESYGSGPKTSLHMAKCAHKLNLDLKE